MKASLLCQHMESALRSGQSEEAIRLAESLLDFLPGHLWAQCLLAQAYLAQGQGRQAQACFDSILERDPECAAAWMGLALLAEAKGQTAHARDCRRRAATFLGASNSPQSQPDFRSEAAVRPVGQGSEVKAAKRVSLDSAPAAANGPAGEELPLVGLMRNYTTSSLQTRYGALLSDYCQRAEALWRLGSLAEAGREARQALQMTPQSLKPTLLLADIAWQRGDQEEFAEWLHKAQSLDPSGVVARRIWGDQHPLLNVLKVDPLLPTTVEEAKSEGAQGGKARERWQVGGGEDTLPPSNPPWLLGSPLLGTGVATGQGGSTQEAPLPPTGHTREATARPQPAAWAHETSRPSGEEEVHVCPLSESQGVDVEFEGDEGARSTPLPCPTQDKLAERPGTNRDAELAEIELELKRIASSLSVPSSLSQQQTVHGPQKKWPLEAPLGLIISNRTALEAKYGPSAVLRVHQALTMLADAMSNEGRMQTLVVYLDDPHSLQPYGFAPADPRDPQELKFTLNRLTECLRNERGRGREEAITYLLLIGGDDIVPFHPLPDPNEDEDELILSDHPYACFSDNYDSFGQAVGRLPDGASRDIGFLLRLITIATEAHHPPRRKISLWEILRERLGRRSAGLILRARRDGAVASFGYTASIWRRAAREVFSSIGQTTFLRTSPPLTCEEMDLLGPIAPRLSYFNLHGVRDSAYWYGQRDPTYAADYPLFPVALRPDNIPVVPHPEAVVFSEACYGAHIFNKQEMSSLALRFLATQAVGVVGSTALAYGSMAPPLVGADLLAKVFWERVKAGCPLGLALAQAKQSLAQEMMTGQGYLDPEDHETILSFVLYGDPTLVVQADSGDETLNLSYKANEEVQSSGPPFQRAETVKGSETTGPILCRRRVVETGLVSPELMARVRHRLASYLPSARQRDVIVSAQMLCHEAHCNEQCSLRQSMAKGHLPAQAKLVFTLRQRACTLEDDVHQQIVKATVDGEGNVVKLAISR